MYLKKIEKNLILLWYTEVDKIVKGMKKAFIKVANFLWRLENEILFWISNLLIQKALT